MVPDRLAAMVTLDTSPLDAAEALRAAGLRVTRPRLAVFDALERAPHADTGGRDDGARPLRAEEVADSVVE
jgi:hypothetical protein